MARAEDGKPLGAFRAAEYPSHRACFLMNSDPASSFGKHMIKYATALVNAYPAIAGHFSDKIAASWQLSRGLRGAGSDN
jgi:hypothetical protein